MILAMLGLFSSARAETLYVAERMRIGLRAEATETAAVVKTVETGTPLEMIERADPEVAREINNSLETLFSSTLPAGRRALIKRNAAFAEQVVNPPLSAQNWYFLYFNLVLMLCLIAAIVLAVR